MPNSVSSSGEESSTEGKNIENFLFGEVSDSSEGEFPKLSNCTVAKRNINVKSLQMEEKQKRSFASAAGRGTRQLSTNKSDLLKYKDMLKIENGVVKVQPPEEFLLTEKKTKTIIFKVYCKKERKIERVSE
uniref:Uncharacterized protein n=1 Tax=Octopus bimaculoides TaxID=37653 RepID=A0A0L8G236_OCTBM